MLPGDEIFLNYGYCNQDIADSYPDWTEYIPKHYHFMILSKMIRRIHRFINKLQEYKYKGQLEHIWMNGTLFIIFIIKLYLCCIFCFSIWKIVILLLLFTEH